jgi:hypothetical protein
MGFTVGTLDGLLMSRTTRSFVYSRDLMLRYSVPYGSAPIGYYNEPRQRVEWLIVKIIISELDV